MNHNRTALKMGSLKATMALTLLTFLAGCGPGEIVTPVVVGGDLTTPTPALVDNTPIPTATATPEATVTPEATATPTTEPAKSPAQIAAGIEGLNQERDYTVQGNYLIDEYNGAKKAVMENNSWRALDYENAEEAEIMYGHLLSGDEVYVDNFKSTSSYLNRSFVGDIDAVYTGDYVIRQHEYSGVKSQMIHLLAVFTDNRGDFNIGELVFDSFEAENDYYATFVCRYDNDYSSGLRGLLGAEISTVMKNIEPGDKLYIRVPDVAVGERIRLPEIWIGSSPMENNADEIAISKIFNENQETWLSRAELADFLASGDWPERLVEIPLIDGVVVERDTRDECYSLAENLVR